MASLGDHDEPAALAEKQAFSLGTLVLHLFLSTTQCGATFISQILEIILLKKASFSDNHTHMN